MLDYSGPPPVSGQAEPAPAETTRFNAKLLNLRLADNANQLKRRTNFWRQKVKSMSRQAHDTSRNQRQTKTSAPSERIRSATSGRFRIASVASFSFASTGAGSFW